MRISITKYMCDLSGQLFLSKQIDIYHTFCVYYVNLIFMILHIDGIQQCYPFPTITRIHILCLANSPQVRDIAPHMGIISFIAGCIKCSFKVQFSIHCTMERHQDGHGKFSFFLPLQFCFIPLFNNTSKEAKIIERIQYSYSISCYQLCI